ncbi:MAG: hypothetical protein LBP38_07510 [Desulfovibrio sp.]|nr:hypothetical protein [Desulfovibrio sp.]
MREAYYVGLDLAKNIFQIVTADEKGLEIGMYRPAPRVKVFLSFVVGKELDAKRRRG